jgi:hypothetical protein
MSGLAVTVVDSGGLPVTAVESGAPLMTAVDSGGLAVTLVDAGGSPFMVEGLFPPINPANKVTNPDDLSAGSWTKTAVGVTPDVEPAPDGSVTMDLLVPTTGNTVHLVTSNTFALGGANTVSFYAKADGYKHLGIREGATSGAYIVVDADAGTIVDSGNSGGYTITGATVEDVGDGIFLFSFTLTGGGSAALQMFILPDSYTTGSPNDAPSWAGNGTSGVLLWRVQAYP